MLDVLQNHVLSALPRAESVSMEEFIAVLKDSLNVLLGALAALLGALVQVRLGERRERERLRTEKLERAYFLCQAVFDGHKREITNAKRFLPNEAEAYLQQRNHPGAEMSELKMLIRSYAKELAPSLRSIDNGHEPLKKSFRELDGLILGRETPSQVDFEDRFKQWDVYLNALSQGSSEIKTGLEKELGKLVSRRWLA